MTQNHLTTFYLVRHAEAENNVKDIIGADSNLTAQGRTQAKLVAKKLAHVQFDAIFASDSLRAKHTAEIIAGIYGNRVRIDKNLRERSYGKYEGVSIKKYREGMVNVFKKMENMTDEDLKTFRRYEGFETDTELMDRVLFSLRHLAISYGGKKLLIVTHGLIMRTLLIYLGFATYKTLPTFSVNNTGYIKIVFDGVSFFVKKTYGIHKLS